MDPALQKTLEELHDRAKAAGLSVRFWDLKQTCLVIALPEDAPQSTAAGDRLTQGGDQPHARQQ